MSLLGGPKENLIVVWNVHGYCANQVWKSKKGKQITPVFATNFLDFPSFFLVFGK